MRYVSQPEHVFVVYAAAAYPLELLRNELREQFGFELHIGLRFGPETVENEELQWPMALVDDIWYSGCYEFKPPSPGDVVYICRLKENRVTEFG